MSKKTKPLIAARRPIYESTLRLHVTLDGRSFDAEGPPKDPRVKRLAEAALAFADGYANGARRLLSTFRSNDS